MIENTKKEKRDVGLSSFVLKIIAIISMTIDHLGYALISYTNLNNLQIITYSMRIIGRLALPIFVFLLLVSLDKTKNIKKYILRLGISAISLYVMFTLIQLIGIADFGFDGNIFMTLFLLALSYYFLFYSKRKYLVILPIIYFLVSSTIKQLYINSIFTKNIALYFFNGLLTQYDIIAPFIFFLSLICFFVYDQIIKKRLDNTELIDAFKDSKTYQKSKNAFVSIIIVFVTLICYLLTYLPSEIYGSITPICDCALQSYMMLSIVFILLYNGQRGYYNKIIKYGTYLYYPLHLAIIYGVLYLIFNL